MNTGVLSREWSGRGVKLTTHLPLAPRLIMSGTIRLPLHSLYRFWRWLGRFYLWDRIREGEKRVEVRILKHVHEEVKGGSRKQHNCKDMTSWRYRDKSRNDAAVWSVIFLPSDGSYASNKVSSRNPCTGPEVSARLMLPDFITFGTWRW